MFLATLTLLFISLLSSLAGQYTYTRIFASLSAAAVLVAGAIVIFQSRMKIEGEYDRIDGVTLDTNRGADAPKDSLVEAEVEGLRREAEAFKEACRDATAAQTSLREKLCLLRNEVIEALPSSLVDTRDTPEISVDLSSLATTIGRGLQTLGGQIEEMSHADSLALVETQAPGERRSTDTKELRVLTLSLEELADRSNILAINAAIEAARIGQAGKGFAVIAGHMQSFSVQSEELARKIRIYGESQNLVRMGKSGEDAQIHERERRFQDESVRIHRLAAAALETVRGIEESFELGQLRDELWAMDARERDRQSLLKRLEELRILAETAYSVE